MTSEQERRLEPVSYVVDPQAQRTVYTREILALRKKVIDIARVAFRGLPSNARGELTCSVRDAQFVVTLWANRVHPNEVKIVLEELGAEARERCDDLAAAHNVREELRDVFKGTAERVARESRGPQRARRVGILQTLGKVLEAIAPEND